MLPPLPAIFGLDPTGVVTKVGDQVRSVRPGDRVYVNPARKCGSCRMCRSGQPLDCPSFTFQGYFGRSQEIMKAYPYGGLCQFITAPEDALVKLPDNVSFEAAARFGYLGTAYAAMKKLGVGPGQTFLVNGISGMLGLNAAMLALAMGATENSRHRPQQGAARSRQGAVAATHRSLRGRRERACRASRSARGLGQVDDRGLWRRQLA